MNHTIYTVNAFSNHERGGNPANVVFCSQKLTAKKMKNIALQAGGTVTAFVFSRPCKSDFLVKYFKPKGEIPFCGHATIGVGFLAAVLGMTDKEKIILDTKAGYIPVEIVKSAPVKVTMLQIPPCFHRLKISATGLCRAMRMRTSYLDKKLPVEEVSTGLWTLILPIVSKNALARLDPNDSELRKLAKNFKFKSIHAFAFEKKGVETIVRARNFSFGYDVHEDIATGSAGGALGCYLFKYKKILNQVIIKQGIEMEMGSKIHVKILSVGKKITSVQVNGEAHLVNKIRR